ncbi:MAG: outer membrane beta-barrel protein [Terriglobales bacterium]
MRNRILFLLVFSGLIASASAQSNFNRFNFTAGLGEGIGRADVAAYVGNSFQGVAGAGINFTRMFGMDAEYMYYDLNFRPSVQLSQALTNQSGRMQSISLDGIVNVPRHLGKFRAYGIFGIGFYRRTVSVPGHQLPAGADYQPAWRWWDLTWENNIPGGQINAQWISSNSKDAGGFNYGGGLTYQLNHLHNSKLYLEWRYHRAYQSDGKTIVMPVTVGLRW